MDFCVTSGIIGIRDDGSAVALREAARFAREAGFSYFDFNLTSRMLLSENWERDIAARAEEAALEGVIILYAHLPFDYPGAGDEEGWERYREATTRGIRVAKALGARCAVLHPRTHMTKDYDEDLEYAAALAFLRPYCEIAHAEGLPLAIENMRGAGASAPARMRRFGCQTDEVIRLARETDEGICWDTGHANISLQNQAKSLQKVGSLLRMVHVNDNFAEDDIHLAPFLGNIAWKEVMRALSDIGFAGALNLEVSCNRLPEPLRRAYAALMYESAKKLEAMFENR